MPGRSDGTIQTRRHAATGTTADVDAVLDVRAISAATEEATRRLQKAGFEPEYGEDGVVYRFIRGYDIVDVLAPDHLSWRSRRTTVPPHQTIEALGARQAFGRARNLLVDAGAGPSIVPLPNLIGAIRTFARVR